MKCALDASRVLQPTFSFPHTNQQQQQVKIHKKKQKTKKKMDKLLQTTHWMRNRSGNLNLPVLKNNEM